MWKLTFKCRFHLYFSLPGSYWYTKTHFKILPPLFLVEAERAERPAPHTHRDQLAADVGNQLYYIFMRWPHPLPPLVHCLECRHFFTFYRTKLSWLVNNDAVFEAANQWKKIYIVSCDCTFTMVPKRVRAGWTAVFRVRDGWTPAVPTPIFPWSWVAQSKEKELSRALDYYIWNNSYWFDMGMAIHFVSQCGAILCFFACFSREAAS